VIIFVCMMPSLSLFLEMVVEWKCHLPLTTTQFRQTLLPNAPELDFDLQPLHEILTLRRLQLREVARQELCEDATKVALWWSVKAQLTLDVELGLPIDLLPSFL
jgi:hypothetical protein